MCVDGQCDTACETGQDCPCYWVLVTPGGCSVVSPRPGDWLEYDDPPAQRPGTMVHVLYTDDCDDLSTPAIVEVLCPGGGQPTTYAANGPFQGECCPSGACVFFDPMLNAITPCEEEGAP